MKFLKRLLFFLPMAMLTTGCTKFAPKRMITEQRVLLEDCKHNDALEVYAQTLGAAQLQNHFGAFKVLYLELKNKTDKPLIFKSSSISLPLASFKAVKKQEPKLYTLYLLPALFSFVSAYFFWYQLALPVTAGCAALAKHTSAKVNTMNIKELKKIAFFEGDKISINPRSSYNLVLFVAKHEYQPRFTVQLTSPDHAINTSIAINIKSKTMHHVRVEAS